VALRLSSTTAAISLTYLKNAKPASSFMPDNKRETRAFDSTATAAETLWSVSEPGDRLITSSLGGIPLPKQRGEPG
jgi:hypothetical protein